MWIRALSVRPSAAVLKVQNNHDFIETLSIEYVCQWEIVKADGSRIAKGSQALPDLLPHGTKEWEIRFPAAVVQDSAAWVNLSVRTTKLRLFVGEGHEVSAWQFPMQMVATSTLIPTTLIHPTKLLVTENSDSVSVSTTTNTFRHTLSKSTGLLTSTFGAHHILTDSLAPNLWRAPTDNDNGGKGNSFAAHWRAAGIDRAKLTNIKVEVISASSSQATLRVQGEIPILQPRGSVTYTANLVVMPDATVDVQLVFAVAYDDKGARPLPLSRAGVLVTLPHSFDYFRWHGRGPHENYEDRKNSALVGIYERGVVEDVTPYVRPQEYGNRCDVRWWDMIEGGTGRKRRVRATATSGVFSSSVHPFAVEVLERAKHADELERDEENVYWYIDVKQMGVGGDDSWSPRTHPEYLLTESRYEVGVRLTFLEDGAGGRVGGRE